MAKKKTEKEIQHRNANPNVIGLQGQVLEQPITETLEVNYMPYAMSVIVSRAIPEIDGFKPSHRKLLYTMYLMNLLKGSKTKSANIVGQTMRLNPHGDAAIYETMVRLSKGNGALTTPFVDSKGNFGKVYSRDMSYAAPRYTEAKLSDICAELFRDIDSDTIDFVDNYDGTMKEPSLLPTTYPNILVSANMGIAVGMASQICGFNLTEVCQATIDYLNDPNCDIMQAMPAPDFATGGEIIYDAAEMRKIYETGRGSFPVRARWKYDQKANIIEIYEIPYTTKSEIIIDKVAELVKTGKVKEISDMRDETGLDGLKLAIDLKKGADPDLLMQKLFKMTSLQDNFPCNFNILIGGYPKVMGVKEILREWCSWRTECVKRRVRFDLSKKQDKLHLLRGLGAILMDIDKAIKIIRETEKEAEVVPNLMVGFGIDEIQANYVAEIKLRNINREYILRRLEETDRLEAEIAELEATLKSEAKIKHIIVRELKDVMKKYPTPRRTGVISVSDVQSLTEEDIVPDYPCTVFLSQQGYFKKITPQSLRMNSEQKYKEGDGPLVSYEATNRKEFLIFTDKQQVYKLRIRELEDAKASVMGTYLPVKLEMDEGENILTMIPADYDTTLLLVFENGKVAKFPTEVYNTKTNRKRLTGAFSDKSPLVAVVPIREETELVLFTSEGRAVLLPTEMLQTKASRTTLGVAVAKMKPKYKVERVTSFAESGIHNKTRYKAKTLPSTGAILRPEDRGETQTSLLGDE